MQGEYGHLCFPCVVERQTWHLVVLCLHRGHTVQCCTLQKCIVHISLCYTVAAVHWCNDDHLFSFARFMDFSWYWAPPQQLYYTIHCTVSSPHVTSKAGSSLFLSIMCLFRSLRRSSIFGYQHSRTYSEWSSVGPLYLNSYFWKLHWVWKRAMGPSWESVAQK